MPKRHHIVPTKGKRAVWRLKMNLMVIGNLNKGAIHVPERKITKTMNLDIFGGETEVFVTDRRPVVKKRKLHVDTKPNSFFFPDRKESA